MASDSEQYRVTLRRIILRGTWLHAVSYCGELDSAQYYTARNSGKIRISRRKRSQKPNCFNPLVSGSGRFEWWKKTGGRKSRWTVPLKWQNTWKIIIPSGFSHRYDLQESTEFLMLLAILFRKTVMSALQNAEFWVSASFWIFNFFLSTRTVQWTLHVLTTLFFPLEKDFACFKCYI